MTPNNGPSEFNYSRTHTNNCCRMPTHTEKKNSILTEGRGENYVDVASASVETYQLTFFYDFK